MNFFISAEWTLRPRSWSWLLAVAALGSWSCTGIVAGETSDGPPGSGPTNNTPTAGATAVGGGTSDSPDLPTTRDGLKAACEAKKGVLDTGRTPLRRLTRLEVDNSIRALLKVEAKAESVAADERMGPFFSNAIAPVDELAVGQYQLLASRVAVEAKTRMLEIAGCDLAADSACPAAFIERFGRQAYRRPLDDVEKTALRSAYDAGKAAGDASLGFQTVLETMLQSPSFLYHDDTYLKAGASAHHPSATPLPLDPYALAARLSFFLLGSTPDQELLTAASQGKLSTPAELKAQAQRLLGNALSQDTIGNFHQQLLGVVDLPEVFRDAKRYPAFSPELAAAAYEETRLFTNYVLRNGDGKLKTLLTSPLAFPQGNLFDVYGVAQPAGYQVGQPVQLDPSKRGGLFTQAAFLMEHAHADQTSPVHRGILIRENILCGHIIPPPGNLVIVIPAVDENTTTRERFAAHVADAGCAGCHKDIDPLGLGFENFDAIGGYRTNDGKSAVDASGKFTNVRPDLEKEFKNAVEMTQAMAQSSEVADCMSRQWFRFALGRVESLADACTIDTMLEEFEKSDGNIPQLLSDIAVSEAFRNVRSTGGNQ
jgi:hypothetical protein